MKTTLSVTYACLVMANKRRLKGKRDRTHSCTGKNRKIKEVKRAPAKSTTRVGVDKPNTFMADLFAPSDDVLLVGEGMQFGQQYLSHLEMLASSSE